jgi:PAS domain S-box-containing protein
MAAHPMQHPSDTPPAPADEDHQRLRRALDSSLDGHWERDLRRGTVWLSDSLRSLFGFAADGLPNDLPMLVARVHPDDLPGLTVLYQRALGDLRPFDYELRFLDQQGRWRWVRGRGRVWPGDDGRPAVVAGAVSDIHQTKQAVLALERMTERFRVAASVADTSVFERMVDEDEMVVSDHLWHSLGYAAGEIPSRRSALVELIHPQDQAAYHRSALAASQRLAPLDVSLRVRCKSGDYRWLRQKAQPQRLSDGRVRVTGVLIDVHEQMRAREALERDRAQLEQVVAERTARLEEALAQAEARRAEADRAHAAKSRFLAHMSHEIRTPLNGALGLTDLALRVAESPAQRRYLELALQSGQALLALIEDVLDVSRLEAGALQLADEPFDLSDTVAEAMRSMVTSTRSNDLAWRLDWVGDTCWVRGDAARVRQILINLLGNAAKFTQRGEIRVVVRASPPDTRGRCALQIEVQDTGPGIAPEQLHSLFGAFVQGDASLARRHGGSGLGLTIARALAKAMGGDLDARSKPGEGATFNLRLNLASAPDPRTPIDLAPALAWFVYPTPEAAQWLARRYQRLGWQTAQQPDVAACIAAVRTTQAQAAALPRLVVIAASALDDDSDLAALRAALPAAHLVILIRADWQRPAIEQRALALGITLALSPLTPRDLRVLGAAAQAAAATAVPAPVPLPPVTGHVLLVEDNAVNRLIGEEFLKTLGLAVRTANDGAECLDACAEAAPELVLMDIQMPVMDGLEATRRLRRLQQQGALPSFPIIALSAHALAGDREQAAAAGMDAYLTKPILLDTFRDALAPWLPGMANEARAAPSAA